jgi:hypothetical protein
MSDGTRWVNEERTRLVTAWSNGCVELAERETPAHTWGPPIALARDGVFDLPAPERPHQYLVVDGDRVVERFEAVGAEAAQNLQTATGVLCITVGELALPVAPEVTS